MAAGEMLSVDHVTSHDVHRITAQFNHTHAVADIRRYINEYVFILLMCITMVTVTEQGQTCPGVITY